MPKRSSMFPQSQDATYNLQTETILLGPPLGGLSDKITDFKTTKSLSSFDSFENSFVIWCDPGLLAILAHCVEQIQDVSAATEVWSRDAARAVSGHGYQFCRELRPATTGPATRQWYSPGQRWEVTCGSRGEMAGGKKGKREVRWRWWRTI